MLDQCEMPRGHRTVSHDANSARVVTTDAGNLVKREEAAQASGWKG
jgi:hypothetical protein